MKEDKNDEIEEGKKKKKKVTFIQKKMGCK